MDHLGPFLNNVVPDTPAITAHMMSGMQDKPVKVLKRIGRAHRTFRSLAVALTVVLGIMLAVSGCSVGPGVGLGDGQQQAGSPTNINSTIPQPASFAANPGQQTKIALLLPISAEGQTAEIAKGLKQAGELALFDRDAPNVKLLVKDTAGTEDGARKAAEEAISEGAKVILGPLFARSVRAVAPLARTASVPVIAFSNDESVAGNGVYLLSFQAHQDVSRIVQFAISRGRLKFAALIPNDARGEALATLFRQAVEQSGGAVVALETYPPGTNGMLEQAQKLFETVAQAEEFGAPIDALFIPGGPEVLPTIAPILRYTKVDTNRVKLIGTGSWDFASLARHAPFIGGWFPAPDPRGWSNFASKYSQTYDAAPPRIATFAYDAVSIAVTLSASGNQGDRFNGQELAQRSGFAGTDGLVRFRSDGLTDRGLAILEVDEAGSRVVDPAPSTFAGP